MELNDACSRIKTPLNDGDAVITPAYDTYFKDALNDLDEHIIKTFNAKSIIECYKYYNKYYDKFERLRKNCFKFYPIMKIFDMCLWQYQKNKKGAE